MVTLLARIFIRDTQDKGKLRLAYGILCGVVGILLNLGLFAGKFIAGRLSGSIAIMADAVNNLSDAGSSIVTLAGFKLAGAKADKEHPFGHGRMEYVSGLVVAAAILIMAYELIRDSVGKILHPQETVFSPVIVGILAVSILVKLYMAFYNSRIAKKIHSAAMRATAIDSLSDAGATTAVLAATLAEHDTGFLADGWCGALVGIFILYAGYRAAKDTLDPLLGQPPEEEFVEKIEQIVLSHEPIRGTHDLIVHDYGPGRQMITLHVEVPSDGDMLQIHDVIDHVENELRKTLGCEATIHMDPIVTSDEHIRALREQTERLLREIDEVLSMHDFRVVAGPSHTNLIFDLLVPFGFRLSDEELENKVRQSVWKNMGAEYDVVMKIDKAYANRE